MLESISDEREASEAGDAEDDQSAVGDSAAISEAGESRDDQSAVGHCEAVGNCEATSDAGDHEATSDLGDGAAKSEAGPGSSAGDCEEAEDEGQVSDQPAIGGEEDASEAASGDHHKGGVHLPPRSPSTSHSTSDWRRRGPRGATCVFELSRPPPPAATATTAASATATATSTAQRGARHARFASRWRHVVRLQSRDERRRARGFRPVAHVREGSSKAWPVAAITTHFHEGGQRQQQRHKRLKAQLAALSTWFGHLARGRVPCME